MFSLKKETASPRVLEGDLENFFGEIGMGPIICQTYCGAAVESVVEICVSLPPQSLAGLRLWLMRLNCYIGQIIPSLSSAVVIAGACSFRFKQ